MAERTGDDAAREAAADMLEALERYTHARGWTEAEAARLRAFVMRVCCFGVETPSDDAEPVSHGQRRWSS